MTDAQDALTNAYETALANRDKLWTDIRKNPNQYRVLTGERPTGPLHIGHYFGTLQNRLVLQDLGVDLWVVIADYQVITDRSADQSIKDNVLEVLADYLAIGIDPDRDNTVIFAHSHIRALNQLLLPFLSLVPLGELQRNPTVKNEIQMAGLKSVSSLMWIYPVHQAADILFCHGNLVPGGKDQLPHIELTRKIARKFNEKYSPQEPYFRQPRILLSKTPHVLGLDGNKMGKSMNNAIFLRATADETAALIKKAKTDADRRITYDPVNRPEVANLLLVTALCLDMEPDALANEIGDGGGGQLKARMTEAVNGYFEPVRKKRAELLADKAHLADILRQGNKQATAVAEKTLMSVHSCMGLV